MIKMIVTDLDGTLLRDDKTISDFTLNALKKCREAGIKAVYATGRGGSAEQRAPSELFDGRITMNGAVAYADGKLAYSRLIPMSLARGLLLACDRQGIKAAAEINDMHYSNFDTSSEWDNITNYSITDFSSHDIDAEKLYAVLKNEEDEAFLNGLMPDGLYMVVSRDGLAQIMHVEATKSAAVSALAGCWGIDISEVAAFGDDLNDIDMLGKCGTGVAMGNALDSVKSISNHVCGTNESDGIAKWLIENIAGL